MKNCIKCSNKLEENVKFCGQCGTEQTPIIIKPKKSWFNHVSWFEFFIAFVVARSIQTFWFPDVSLIILLPAVWVAVHFLLGKWIVSMDKKDIFKRKSKNDY